MCRYYEISQVFESQQILKFILKTINEPSLLHDTSTVAVENDLKPNCINFLSTLVFSKLTTLVLNLRHSTDEHQHCSLNYRNRTCSR